MGTFTNKVAVVTGGASGIGQAVGFALADGDAQVVLLDINVDGLKASVDRIIERGGRARWLEVNVADAGQVSAAIDDIYGTEGPIDYLFNNAGIAVIGEAYDMTPTHWQNLVNVNIVGVVNGVAAVYPRMVERGSGHIINTASVAGLVPTPLLAAYGMTKHAVVGLSTSLRAEGRAKGVRVSAVCPGVIDTPLAQTLTLLNLDRDKALADNVLPMGNVQRCARTILQGVARNRDIILVTGHARMMWWTYRFLPRFLTRAAGAYFVKRARRDLALPAE